MGISVSKKEKAAKKNAKNRRRINKIQAGKRKIRWEKLDNTANLFPAIATQDATNVYRISVVLKEEVDAELLQDALDKVLPRFSTFCVRMRKGIFWNYFETNTKPAPLVYEENDYPCRYIEQYDNNNYLFRVTYYKCRINLEVFHVLADGMGGVTFLRELTYQYLRNKYSVSGTAVEDVFSDETSLNTEDSYLKHYRQSHKKTYGTKKAVQIKGERLLAGEIRVIHGFMSVTKLKEVSKKYQSSINEYLTAVFLYSMYVEYLHSGPSKRPLAAAIPVNLRPYFDSATTRNFFVMVSAVFHPQRAGITLEEIITIVKKSLRSQITKEHLEEMFSYNVSNQKNIVLRSIPMFLKIIAMRIVYFSSARANTTTVTNIGTICLKEEYKPYVKGFTAMLSRSAGQNIKGTICSYEDTLVFTISSVLADNSIAQRFYRTLAREGLEVSIETNKRKEILEDEQM